MKEQYKIAVESEDGHGYEEWYLGDDEVIAEENYRIALEGDKRLAVYMLKFEEGSWMVKKFYSGYEQ